MSIIPITWNAHILPIMHLINPFLLILFLLPTSPIIFPIILIIELISLTSLHHFLSPSMVLTIPTYPSPPFLYLNLHMPLHHLFSLYLLPLIPLPITLIFIPMQMFTIPHPSPTLHPSYPFSHHPTHPNHPCIWSL